MTTRASGLPTASITGGLDALAAFARDVKGIKTSYGLRDLPEKIPASALPAALVSPEFGKNSGAYEFKTLAFMGGGSQVFYTAKQLILVAPTTEKIAKVAFQLLEIMDYYLIGLRDYPFLLPLDSSRPTAIHEAAKVKPNLDAYEYGGIEYYGAEFNYALMFNL